jgi:transcriptional regulator with XRE-family HTH domain
LGPSIRIKLFADRWVTLLSSVKPTVALMKSRTRLFRGYLSRLANGRTVPSIETLEKLARALEVPLHRRFTDDKAPAKKLRVPKDQPATIWGLDKKTTRQMRLFAKQFARMDGKQRWLIPRAAAKINKDGHS